MFLAHKRSGDLIEVLNPQELYNPYQSEITGRFHHGEEMQDPEAFLKSDIVFPSGELLPRCWLDPNYRSQSKAA